MSNELEAGSGQWWYQVYREETLYGYSETLHRHYAEQGIVISHG